MEDHQKERNNSGYEFSPNENNVITELASAMKFGVIFGVITIVGGLLKFDSPRGQIEG
jgi:hypothetical protein